MTASLGTGDLIVVIPLLFSSMAAAVVSIIGALRVGHVAEKVTAVHNEVKTMNELTIGQLAEAGETQRIARKTPEDRTPREARHIAAARDVPPGYGPTPDEPSPPHDLPGPAARDHDV